MNTVTHLRTLLTIVLTITLLYFTQACAVPVEASTDTTTIAPVTQPVSAPARIELTVEISPEFNNWKSAHYVDAIVAALAQWENATAGQVHLTATISDVDSGTGVYIRPATAADVRDGQIKPNSLGNVTCLGCYPTLMLINLGVAGVRSNELGVSAEQVVTFTVAHELGHVLGIDHTEQGLMRASDVDAGTGGVDAQALAEFCKIKGC